MLESLLTGWLGQAGIIFIVAQLIDLIEKRMDKRGLFEDLGKLAERTGAGLGKMLAGLIPGKQIEPEIAGFLKHLENAEDSLSNAIIDQLKKETQNSNNE